MARAHWKNTDSTWITMTQCGGLPSTAKRRSRSGATVIRARPFTRSVSPAPGNQEQQRHARVGQQVAQAVDAVVAAALGQQQRLVVLDGDKTRRVAAR
jgi:hypothetical protein